MRKRELEKLLIQAVAEALGLELNEQTSEKSARAPRASDHDHRAAA